MSASSPLGVALLIVSTTAAKDPSTDASGTLLKDVIEQEGGSRWQLVDTKIVPDDVVQIQRQIMLWADMTVPGGINLILTTGGTGFAVADNTPEVTMQALVEFRGRKHQILITYWQAVSALLHKQAPGIVHGMLSASLSVTPCK